jgi:hypothetical protein
MLLEEYHIILEERNTEERRASKAPLHKCSNKLSRMGNALVLATSVPPMTQTRLTYFEASQLQCLKSSLSDSTANHRNVGLGLQSNPLTHFIPFSFVCVSGDFLAPGIAGTLAHTLHPSTQYNVVTTVRETLENLQ